MAGCPHRKAIFGLNGDSQPWGCPLSPHQFHHASVAVPICPDPLQLNQYPMTPARLTSTGCSAGSAESVMSSICGR